MGYLLLMCFTQDDNITFCHCQQKLNHVDVSVQFSELHSRETPSFLRSLQMRSKPNLSAPTQLQSQPFWVILPCTKVSCGNPRPVHSLQAFPILTKCQCVHGRQPQKGSFCSTLVNTCERVMLMTYGHSDKLKL